MSEFDGIFNDVVEGLQGHFGVLEDSAFVADLREKLQSFKFSGDFQLDHLRLRDIVESRSAAEEANFLEASSGLDTPAPAHEVNMDVLHPDHAIRHTNQKVCPCCRQLRSYPTEPGEWEYQDRSRSDWIPVVVIQDTEGLLCIPVGEAAPIWWPDCAAWRRR